MVLVQSVVSSTAPEPDPNPEFGIIRYICVKPSLWENVGVDLVAGRFLGPMEGLRSKGRG